MNKLKFTTLITSIILCFSLYIKCSSPENMEYITIRKQVTIDDPPCLQLYYFINKYAKKYNIPLSYAYGLAYQETRYQGPFNWRYNHKQTSPVGAVGPMQVMIATANGIWNRKVDVDSLKNNIELNVHTSMKLLRLLKDKHKDWKLVMGAYNTGRPLINEYAMNIVNEKYEWVK